MVLPVILLCDNYQDMCPKQLLNAALPKLVARKYTTLCFEAPQDLSSEEIIRAHRKTLQLDIAQQVAVEARLKEIGMSENTIKNLHKMDLSKLEHLIKHNFSNSESLSIAQVIKLLPGSYLLKTTFAKAAELSMEIRGIDLGTNEGYNAVPPLDPSEAMLVTSRRVQTMVANIMRLREESEEIVFLCHESLVEKLSKALLEREVKVLPINPKSLPREKRALL